MTETVTMTLSSFPVRAAMITASAMLVAGAGFLAAAAQTSGGAQKPAGTQPDLSAGQGQLRLTLGVATYGDALVCFQYYEVAAELARKLERNDNVSADAAAGFQLQALAARRAQAGWSQRVKAMSGGKSDAQISADLKRVSAPVIADANAALAGDKTGAERTAARAETCAKLEDEAASAR
jgi:hypothetical protein